VKEILMKGVQKSLRLPEETLREIEELSAETGQDFSTITKDLLTEAIKMRRCPGIIFGEGVSGRRAKVAGTGIEVWEIIAAYKSVGKDLKKLKKTYHWLSQEQVKAVLSYYSAYPEEIDRLIERNESWTKKKIQERHPLMSSRS
jgi:uncharacterized protein (DUF433 family)